MPVPWSRQKPSPQEVVGSSLGYGWQAVERAGDVGGCGPMACLQPERTTGRRPLPAHRCRRRQGSQPTVGHRQVCDVVTQDCGQGPGRGVGTGVDGRGSTINENRGRRSSRETGTKATQRRSERWIVGTQTRLDHVWFPCWMKVLGTRCLPVVRNAMVPTDHGRSRPAPHGPRARRKVF